MYFLFRLSCFGTEQGGIGSTGESKDKAGAAGRECRKVFIRISGQERKEKAN